MFFHIPLVLAQIKDQLTEFLQADAVVQVFRDAGMSWRNRVLDPLTTLRLFVLQILHGNTAINHLRHFHSHPFTDSAYCQARGRLPLEVLQQLLQRLVAALKPLMNDDEGRWLGHRTFHIDGSAFSMPDTPELQRAFGQPGGQKPGCGFPVAHILTLFHAGMGFLQRVLAAPLRTHDMAQTAQMHPELQAGDVLIGDRAFCSFAHLALLFLQKLHGVFRIHQRQLVDFKPRRPYNKPGKKRRKGLPNSRWVRRLGAKDQLVEWFKPKDAPDWMSAEQYAVLPASLLLRELRYQIDEPGFRTKEVTLVTTLLDPDVYSAQALAQIYRQRWQIETNLRHLKQTMGLDVLHCATKDGVLKELTIFAMVYNLVRVVMGEAARRQEAPLDRISFIDALRWISTGNPNSPLPTLIVNPWRPGRSEPRVRKRRPKEYPLMKRPRKELRQRLENKQLAA
jgi:Transposase DDE domain